MSAIGPGEAGGSRLMTGRSTKRLTILATLMIVLGLFGLYRSFSSTRHSAPAQVDTDEAIVGVSATLEKMPAGRRGSYLLDLLRAGGPSERYAAVDELVKERPPGTADALEAAFRDDYSRVRIRATETLPDVDRARGKRLLLSGLFDEDCWVRDAAIAQLRVSRNGKADRSDTAALVRALDDTDSNVVSSSANLLSRLTGVSHRIRNGMTADQRAEVIRQWKRWAIVNSAGAATPTVEPIVATRTEPAPDSSIQDIDGDTISLDSQRGKITVLNFWATWCGPCKEEVPDLIRLDAEYRPKGVDLVGVALDEKSPDSLRSWCERNGVKYRQALADDAITAAYGHVEQVPVTVVIDRHGAIRYRWDGERDFDSFKATVERLLREP